MGCRRTAGLSGLPLMDRRRNGREVPFADRRRCGAVCMLSTPERIRLRDGLDGEGGRIV